MNEARLLTVPGDVPLLVSGGLLLLLVSRRNKPVSGKPASQRPCKNRLVTFGEEKRK